MCWKMVPQSAFAAFFDIEWHPHSRSLDGKILLPVLGRPFGEALDSGEIKLTFQDGRFFFQYFDSLFPLTPRSYHAILDHRFDRLKEILGKMLPPTTNIPGSSRLSGSFLVRIDGLRKPPPNGDCALNRLAIALNP